MCVVGPVSVRTYDGNDGKTRASLEVTAEDVEFLSPKDSPDLYQVQKARKEQETEAAYQKAEREAIQNENKYVKVEDDDLPFD